MKVHKGILAGGLALVLPLVALLASGFGTDPNAVPSVLVGTPATSFDLVDLDGQPHRLADLKGQPVVLNFWSTWCVPCKIEHPLLQSAAQGRSDIAFFGVLYGDDPRRAREFLAREPLAYPVLVDPTDALSVDYGVVGVPETFFIARDGTIRHKHVGPLDAASLDRWLMEIGR